MLMKAVSAVVAASVLAGMLADCSQTGQQNAAASGRMATQQHAVATPTSTGGAVLTVQPDSVDGCKPNQPIVAKVSWHSLRPKVKIMVAAPGQATPHLFSDSGYMGSANTGDWVVANTRFELVDATTGKVLAKRTVTAAQCN